MAPRPSLTLGLPTVKTLHKTPYPAISPLRPELSQAGRTVLITGASVGIGFAIARAFVQAKTTRLIITGRRQSVLDDAARRLEAEASKAGSPSVITSYSLDVSSLEATEKLWTDLKRDVVVVDVLVLNAASLGHPGKPVIDMDLDALWQAYGVNVRSLFDHTQRFYKQEGKGATETKVLRARTALSTPLP